MVTGSAQGVVHPPRSPTVGTKQHEGHIRAHCHEALSSQSVTVGCRCVPNQWALQHNPDCQEVMSGSAPPECLPFRRFGAQTMLGRHQLARTMGFTFLDRGQPAKAGRAHSGCGQTLREWSNVLSSSGHIISFKRLKNGVHFPFFLRLNVSIKGFKKGSSLVFLYYTFLFALS